jgi:hypothetical protein
VPWLPEKIMTPVGLPHRGVPQLSPAIEKRIRDQLRAGNSVWGE